MAGRYYGDVMESSGPLGSWQIAISGFNTCHISIYLCGSFLVVCYLSVVVYYPPISPWEPPYAPRGTSIWLPQPKAIKKYKCKTNKFNAPPLTPC